MAVTLKRKRDAVSYREPDSEEDLLDDSDASQHVRRTRAAPTRHSTRRKDPTNTQASTAVLEGRADEPRNSRQPRARKVSYKDISTDEENEDPDADFQVSEEETIDRPKPVRAASSPRKSKSSKNKISRRFGAALKPNVPAQQNARKVTAIPSDGHVPAWTSLPYHVWLQVFVYASHPLRDENMRPTPSISWLVKMARICSAFTKPALTALYRNPPVFAMRQTRKDLVYQLVKPPSDEHEDRRVMVKRLELDATQMTSLTDHVNSLSDLESLIGHLTTLRELDIFDPFDRPPFRERLRRIRRWVYPAELFDALRHSDLRLRSWRWNSSFCDQGLLWMKSMHGEQMFQNVRELTLQKFHPPEVRNINGEDEVPAQPTAEELLASALAVLPNLKSLSFETCGIVSGRLLPLLANDLVSLSITNCGELLSENLQAFLATHGAQLKDLILNYNQSLDLSFLVDLKQSCPKLECLRMDLTYYSSLAMSSDNDPLYETLLGENEVPTWPTTLHIIDLQFLRNWSSKSATNFLSSLVDASGHLPWLRELIIIASVDTDWRERAGFRQKWTDKFKKVFARPWVSPNPHLASLKAYREWKISATNLIVPVMDPAVRVQDAEPATSVADVDHSDSDTPLIRSKRDEQWDTKRLRSRSKATGSYDEDTDDNDASSDGGPKEEEELVIQGRCHTVLFRIDNIRPQEEHFTEADFLDAEPSDDGDWNGNDDANNDEAGRHCLLRLSFLNLLHLHSKLYESSRRKRRTRFPPPSTPSTTHYKEIVYRYSELDSHSDSSHDISVGKNVSHAILSDVPSSFSRSTRQARKKEPEKGWADLCTQLDAEVTVQLEERAKAYAEITPVYENGKLVQQITRFSDSPEVRIRYYLPNGGEQKVKAPSFGNDIHFENHHNSDKHGATENWVKECAARDAAFALEHSIVTSKLSCSRRTVKFADEQDFATPALTNDTSSDNFSHLSADDLELLRRQQCDKMVASFEKCDATSGVLYSKMKEVNAQFGNFSMEARKLMCRRLCPEMYDAAKRLLQVQHQLVTAQNNLREFAEELEHHKNNASFSRDLAAQAKADKKQLQQTFNELTQELYLGSPLDHYSGEGIMAKRVGELEERLWAKTVECNGKNLMIAVLKNEIDQHECEVMSYNKKHESLKYHVHVIQKERDEAVMNAGKSQAELEQTQEELDRMNEALQDLEGHTFEVAEEMQANIIEAAVALEDLTEQIAGLHDIVEHHARENKSLALQLKIEREQYSGAKKNLDKLVKGYIKTLSDNEGKSLLAKLRSEQSDSGVTTSSDTPKAHRVKVWLKKTDAGSGGDESAGSKSSAWQSSATVSRGRHRTRFNGPTTKTTT